MIRLLHGPRPPRARSWVKMIVGMSLSFAPLCFAVVLATLVADSSADDDLAMREEAAWRNAVAAVADSVVQIRLVGGLETVDKVIVAQGPTTGLIVSADGYIVSSAYPFAQRPSSILVMLPGGDRLPAQLVATNHSRKFVLLKVDPPAPLPAIQNSGSFGKNGFRDVHSGQWAIAVGRTMQNDVVNTSVGVVSAVGRMQGRALQTDAKVSPASYGGALIDVRGRVLGVLVPMSPEGESEVAGASFYDSGIAFAVPLAQIFAALPRLQGGEDLHRGLLGVSFPKGASYRQPPRVVKVRTGSPADKAGLQPEDVILSVDGRAVATAANLRAALGPRYAGERVEIKLRRGDEELAITAELTAELPPADRAARGGQTSLFVFTRVNYEYRGAPMAPTSGSFIILPAHHSAATCWLPDLRLERFQEPDRVADFDLLSLGI